jgi:hypothetical protein
MRKLAERMSTLARPPPLRQHREHTRLGACGSGLTKPFDSHVQERKGSCLTRLLTQRPPRIGRAC